MEVRLAPWMTAIGGRSKEEDYGKTTFSGTVRKQQMNTKATKQERRSEGAIPR